MDVEKRLTQMSPSKEDSFEEDAHSEHHQRQWATLTSNDIEKSTTDGVYGTQALYKICRIE